MTSGATVDVASLPALRRHVAVVHHVPGRIRLRLGASLLDADSGVDVAALRRLLGSLAGIRDVRLNPAVASLAIQYDPEHIRPGDWDTLLTGDPATARTLVECWLGMGGQPRNENQADQE
ncbi:MAG: hypothetical protein WBP72_02380 [Rhodocyclaceae bacterium]|jgi:hypothetical protein